MKSVRAMTLGLFFGLAYGCQFDRPLGDLPDGGNGDGDAGTGGSGTATGGAGGYGNGGSGNGGSANGGSLNGGSENGGSTSGGSSAGGTSPNGGTGGSGDCFSPDQNPELSLEPGAVGCACDGSEPDQCIVVSEAPALHLMAMLCRDGRWQTAEDGPCEPTGPGCMLENRVIYERRYVPNQLLCEFCAWCEISDPVCALIDCPPSTCPSGTVESSSCRACGPVDACDIVEYGCLPTCENGDECDGGRCLQGVCRQTCP